MTQAQFASWLKTTLGFAAGIAVAKGWISASAGEGLIGVALAVVPLVWGFLGNTVLAQVQQTSALEDVQKVVLKPSVGDGLAAAAADPSQPKIVKQ
jgi:hypothetical protein